ncbi:MAG: HDIG domain-containing protein [Muribaculaceae bacterium]|nr:HDIG domain-containing protein [Muribaculaceae bacterium]MDE6462649.1 HDIG domain-containing protein [Muribaculaceae bacterium]
MDGTLCLTDSIIEKYYPAGTRLRDIFLMHARQVADEAVGIARRIGLPLAEEEIRAAAMLHDIGIFLTDAPDIDCHGSAPYIEHGPLGAELLRREGMPESWARVAERHTGTGLPPLVPETLLERLVCYADKFYSKSGAMKRKTLEQVEKSMLRFGPDNLERFRRLHSEFNPS